ncbi:Acetyltransferase GNAT family [Staphylococcus aureus]|nr:Acetyltransferase GNAT family [Staphylococcus aureus]
MIYCETERLILRDWHEDDLLPFQKMNANYDVRKYFPSLLSYRRSELDMRTMDAVN